MGIQQLNQQIVECRRCPRLVAWREKVAQEKVRRFADEAYWGKPVPGFGDPEARLLIVGLAPAAHGANRTGRMFTGDRSGDWLYRSLFKFGFASQPESVHRADGLQLRDCYITASLRCAPPQNKPTAEEKSNCFSFVLAELKMLPNVKVLVALGKIAFDISMKMYKELDRLAVTGSSGFAHGAEIQLNQDIVLLTSYHPSQQNTFTGRLTEVMFDSIFARARQLIN